MKSPEPRYLQCVLTDDEIREKGKLLAQAEADHASAERELNAVKENFKGKLTGFRTKIESLTGDINTGREFRYVEVHEEFDYERMKVDLYRNDTGEKIDQRNMTTKEIEDWRQRKLFAEETEAAAQAMAAGAGGDAAPATIETPAEPPAEPPAEGVDEKASKIRKVK